MMAEGSGSTQSYSQSRSHKDNWIVACAHWISDHWSTIALLVFPALLSLAGLAVSGEVLGLMDINELIHPSIQAWAIRVIILITLAHLAIGSIHLWREKRLSKVQKELKAHQATEALFIENASAMCTGYLADLASWLEFGTQGQNTERITLYVHDSERHFQQVGRFSFNQSLVKSGRARYPELQGCIGKAWENGWAFETLPEEEADYDGWLTACVASGVPKTTAEKLNMKSACYAACTVRLRPTDAPIGVLVIESLKSDRFTLEAVQNAIQEHRRGYIAWMIEALPLGEVSDARKEGF